MTRLARAMVTLSPGRRPRSAQVLADVREALDLLTDGTCPTGDVRFVGWDGERTAVYEADYPGAAGEASVTALQLGHGAGTDPR